MGVPVGRPGGHRASGWRGDQVAHEKSPAPPQDQARIRQLMNEAFLKSRPEAEAALKQCFSNPKTVLACVELLARLNGELP